MGRNEVLGRLKLWHRLPQMMGFWWLFFSFHLSFLLSFPFLPPFVFSRRRRFTSNCQRHTRSQKNDVRYITFAMLFWALVEGCRPQESIPEKFWEVAVLWKASKIFLMSVPPSGVAQPGPFPPGETAKWTILRPSGNLWFGRSKIVQGCDESMLAGFSDLECRRTIRAVRTRIDV